MMLYRGFGLLLLGAAFLGGAAEIAAQATLSDRPWMLPAIDVWIILAPSSLEAARRALGPEMLDALAGSLLILPAWLLFGLPGAALAWLGRPQDDETEGPDEESLFLYDRLAKLAREEGYGNEPGDGPDIHTTLAADDEDGQSGDDLAPTQQLLAEDEDSGQEGDDSAPTDQGYAPADLGDAKTWIDAEGADRPSRPPEAEGQTPAPAEEKPRPFSVPKPPPAGLGHWVPPARNE
ncbi:MAG: hypothetical protein H7841_09625 [Magnetospirillum sp. WYHS-4]